MKYNWNPMTADEPDPYPSMREDAISSKAESLMSDEDWIAAALYDGLTSQNLAAALAEPYRPDYTHARVGGLLIDALWDLAIDEAIKIVDDGPADYDGE